MFGPDNARGPWDLLACDHVFEKNLAPDPRSFACECCCPTCYETNQIKRKPVSMVMVTEADDVIRILNLWLAHHNGVRPTDILWANKLGQEVTPLLNQKSAKKKKAETRRGMIAPAQDLLRHLAGTTEDE